MQEKNVYIALTEERYRENLTQAAALGAHLAMQQAGLPVREYFTREEMKRKHGAGRINRLIQSGRLTPHKLPEYDENTANRIVYSETEYLSQII